MAVALMQRGRQAARVAYAPVHVLIAAASTLVLSFVSVEQVDQGLWRFLWLLLGLTGHRC